MNIANEETTCSRCGCIGCPQLLLDGDAPESYAAEPAFQRYLDKTFYSSLCKTCVGDLHNKVAYAVRHPIPVVSEDFEEGVHYGIENGLWVFSELYHIMKGYCCRNGCKNCAYGFSRRRG